MIQLHDTPPPKNHGASGRQLPKETLDLIAVLKANPGKWAQAGHKKNTPSWPKTHGLTAVLRNRDSDGRYELWLSCPAAPVDTGPEGKPSTNGMVLRCDDCGWETATDRAPDLDKHCRRNHNRPASKIERTPIEADQ